MVERENIDTPETAPITWYENYFNNRVKPKVCEEMNKGNADGFYPWLSEHRPDLYNQIQEAETEINSLWLSQADHDSFKTACKIWFNLLMEAKKGYEAWKAMKRQEAILAGRQEAMALR